MTTGYRLLTTKVAEGLYRHELVSYDGTIIDVSDFSEKAMIRFDEIANRQARGLYYREKENKIFARQGIPIQTENGVYLDEEILK